MAQRGGENRTDNLAAATHSHKILGSPLYDASGESHSTQSTDDRGVSREEGRSVGMFGDHVLLMTATGAKSGDAITTPLVYGRQGDDYVVCASKGGAPENPVWLANIEANPNVEVEVADTHGTVKFRARARVVDSRDERDRLYKEMLNIWPAFADYQARTERLIPVVVLERQP